MTSIHSTGLLHFLIIFASCMLINSQDVAKLPHCNENILSSELILVSTLDGLLTALDTAGDAIWKLQTGPGPLLKSNIHKLELTNNGQWLRIIPSLSGGLYKFDGVTIDPIPISADTLLTSSFRYSDDLVIAGGREVRTYGVLLKSGTQLYECSLTGCANTTDSADDLDDVIIVERTTHTVRAVEPRTGTERWNFSVGQHNIKVPYVNCVGMDIKTVDFNISAVLPEGLLIASNAETLWEHKFESPIVAVWKWTGHELITLNLFSPMDSAKNNENIASIYVGMHNKQLYVHESSRMHDLLQLKLQLNNRNSVMESRSLTQIPWKPIPATSEVAKYEATDDSTALSVLYASEYVNGNGYYLLTEEKQICENNITKFLSLKENMNSIWYWWKRALAVAITTILICNFIYNYGFFGIRQRISTQDVSLLPLQTQTSTSNSSNSDFGDVPFISRYITEFEPISCLGKGGFGVVFQAKKKFDECDYAVKRITLPNKPTARDRMMREVKALAKLDHSNIVRYYNAWLEYPPYGWQHEHDQQWSNDMSLSYIDKSSKYTQDLSTNGKSLPIKLNSNNLSDEKDDDISSSIVFEKNSSTALQISDVSNSTCNNTEGYTSNSLNTLCGHPAPIYLYIQMQLCSKESLKDWLNNNSNRDHFRTLEIFEQIINAVDYVHFRGLIHRDLKPSNIFFSLEGQIKVGDFGLVTSVKEYDGSNDSDQLAAYLQESYTNAVGTQLYMSPEQLEGQQYDHKVDIYSLGIIFFELLVAFRTEMERIRTLTDLRKNIYPNNFANQFSKEHELLKLMLAVSAEKRPMAREISTKLSFENTNES